MFVAYGLISRRSPESLALAAQLGIPLVSDDRAIVEVAPGIAVPMDRA